MRRFILPISASVALVISAPFIGQLRAAVQDWFPGQYRLLILTAVFGSIGVAVAAALVHIRDRRALRYGCIVAALTFGTGYAMWSRTGDPAVDAVERFHFVEYGLIALLFYRAWRPIGDGSLLILPLLAGLLVGIAEEWLQWFIPARVGELHDVMLNLWAIGCGVLFSLGLDPPEKLSLTLPRASWRRVKRFAAAVLIAFAVFLQSVHVGYLVVDPNAGTFRSLYHDDDLAELSRNRAERWRANPPLTWSRLSREDQYLTAGVSHVRRRNTCWSEGNVRCARHENLILEAYFAPVLDTPTYISATGLRWPAEQRADVESRAGSADPGYISEADETPIFVWPKPIFWGVVAVVVLLLLW
jgi:hypothetical protein